MHWLGGHMQIEYCCTRLKWRQNLCICLNKGPGPYLFQLFYSSQFEPSLICSPHLQKAGNKTNSSTASIEYLYKCKYIIPYTWNLYKILCHFSLWAHFSLFLHHCICVDVPVSFKATKASCLQHSWVSLASRALKTQHVVSDPAFIEEYLNWKLAPIQTNMF